MPVANSEIARIFETLANLLEIEAANPFRVRAYRNAARSVRAYSRSMEDMLDQGVDLSQIPNISNDLAAKIKCIVDISELPLLKEVESRTPAALSDMTKIPGLGPKRVKTLYHELGISSIEELQN